MTGRATGRGLARAALAAGLLLAVTPAARAQNHQPGLIDALGALWRNSTEKVDNAAGTPDEAGAAAGTTARGAAAGTTARGAAAAAKDAADAMVRLPNTRIVSGRVRCAEAANGAPDCQSAAETVCRAKEFSKGASLDIETAQDCPVRVWLSGRPAEPGECRMSTYVVRAVCQ